MDSCSRPQPNHNFAIGSPDCVLRKGTMAAYILAPICAFISSVFFFLPSELALLVLANMDMMTFNIFGTQIDIAQYSTSFPWLLPVVAAAGSVPGSWIYYSMGSGAMKMSVKVKNKIESFDTGRLGNVREAVVLVSNIISVPPVSLTSVASGILKIDLRNFLVVSFIGKVVRYYIVLLVGQFAIDLATKWFG